MLTLLPAADAAAQALWARLLRVSQRHPLAAERCLARLAADADALYLRFALLEPRGRAAELREALTAAQTVALTEQRALHAARLSEALGRIAYQQGEYQQAEQQWARALALASSVDNVQMAVAARIGLGQIRFGHGDWAGGLRLHQAAATQLDAREDSYLAAKLALNLGVGHLELGELPAAERQFSHGLAAARRGGHREFEAEAHWHLAQTSLARHQLHFATADCRLVLGIAARHGFSWLEAAASRTWTEIALARGDTAAAIRSTRHGLALAERIQARAQASQAHALLAKLLQQEGEHAVALDHLRQHMALQAELERLSEPRGDAGAVLGAAHKLLSLAHTRLWLAQSAPGAQTLDALADIAPGYLALLGRQQGALVLNQAEQHPCQAELTRLPAELAGAARIELALRHTDGSLAGVLWLVDAQPQRQWKRREGLIARQLAALLETVVL